MVLPRVVLAVLIGGDVDAARCRCLWLRDQRRDPRDGRQAGGQVHVRARRGQSVRRDAAKEKQIQRLQADLADDVAEDDIAQPPVVVDVQARLAEITTALDPDPRESRPTSEDAGATAP